MNICYFTLILVPYVLDFFITNKKLKQSQQSLSTSIYQYQIQIQQSFIFMNQDKMNFMSNLLKQREEQINQLTEQLRSVQEQNMRIKVEKEELQKFHDMLLKNYEQMREQLDKNNQIKGADPSLQQKQKQLSFIRIQEKQLNKLKEMAKRMIKLGIQNRKYAIKLIQVDKLCEQFKKLQERNSSLQIQIKTYKKLEEKEIQDFQLSKTVIKTGNDRSGMKKMRTKQLITISINQILQFISFYIEKLQNNVSKIQAINTIERLLRKTMKKI